jgi:hypothetical protein
MRDDPVIDATNLWFDLVGRRGERREAVHARVVELREQAEIELNVRELLRYAARKGRIEPAVAEARIDAQEGVVKLLRLIERHLEPDATAHEHDYAPRGAHRR